MVLISVTLRVQSQTSIRAAFFQNAYHSQFHFRVYDLMFFDETAKIEAHESEVLCVEFSPTDTGMEWKLIISFKI